MCMCVPVSVCMVKSECVYMCIMSMYMSKCCTCKFVCVVIMYTSIYCMCTCLQTNLEYWLPCNMQRLAGTHMYVYEHTCIHVYAHIEKHTRLRATYLHSCRILYIHIHIYIYMYIYIYMHIYIYAVHIIHATMLTRKDIHDTETTDFHPPRLCLYVAASQAASFAQAWQTGRLRARGHWAAEGYSPPVQSYMYVLCMYVCMYVCMYLAKRKTPGQRPLGRGGI